MSHSVVTKGTKSGGVVFQNLCRVIIMCKFSIGLWKCDFFFSSTGVSIGVKTVNVHLYRVVMACYCSSFHHARYCICAVADGAVVALVLGLKEKEQQRIRDFGRAIGHSTRLPALTLFPAACQMPVCLPARPLLHCCAYLAR